MEYLNVWSIILTGALQQRHSILNACFLKGNKFYLMENNRQLP